MLFLPSCRFSVPNLISLSLWPRSAGGSAHVTLVWEFDWLLCVSPITLGMKRDLFSEQEVCVCGKGKRRIEVIARWWIVFADARALSFARIARCVPNATTMLSLISKCQAASVSGIHALLCLVKTYGSHNSRFGSHYGCWSHRSD